MSKDILLVFGMQNDYVKKDEIVSRIIDKIKYYSENDKPYYLIQNNCYSSNFCQIHSDGWQFIDEIKKYVNKDNVIKIFDSNANLYWNELSINASDTIDICGFYTDRGIVGNALVLKAKNIWTRIKIDVDCCYGTSPEYSDSALDVLESNGIEVNYVRRDSEDEF